MEYLNREFAQNYRQRLIRQTSLWPKHCQEVYKKAVEVILAAAQPIPVKLLKAVILKEECSFDLFIETMSGFVRKIQTGDLMPDRHLSLFLENDPGSLQTFLQFSSAEGHQILADFCLNYYQSNGLAVRIAGEDGYFDKYKEVVLGYKVKVPPLSFDLDIMFYTIRFLPIHILQNKGPGDLKKILEDTFYQNLKLYIPFHQSYKDYKTLFKILNLDPDQNPNTSDRQKIQIWFLLREQLDNIKMKIVLEH